ncbi:hypothetical protein [Vibrio pectenicida]|uniref:Uncharacterized protein n=1 Tax=Vibrio pectenicida TaxID=62763 RepID=A0A427U4L3_9VIBR|nr:hypothetical protein [Vibrio pectenicida]RSD30693.1 hypothetical protein EJA03_12645 [Vibrio pectenicida]RSD31606.1 hypothetical protein EJA03_07975 [Vibrio pectenicida]
MKIVKAMTALLMVCPLWAHSAKIQVKTIGMDGSEHQVVNELKKYHNKNMIVGDCGNKVEINCQGNDKVEVLLINTLNPSVNYDNPGVLNKIKKSDWTVLIGGYAANQTASFKLLGYGVSKSIVAIKKPGDRVNMELFTYRYNAETLNSKLASKMVDSFL